MSISEGKLFPGFVNLPVNTNRLYVKKTQTDKNIFNIN